MSSDIKNGAVIARKKTIIGDNILNNELLRCMGFWSEQLSIEHSVFSLTNIIQAVKSLSGRAGCLGRVVRALSSGGRVCGFKFQLRQSVFSVNFSFLLLLSLPWALSLTWWLIGIWIFVYYNFLQRRQKRGITENSTRSICEVNTDIRAMYGKKRGN